MFIRLSRSINIEVTFIQVRWINVLETSSMCLNLNLFSFLNLNYFTLLFIILAYSLFKKIIRVHYLILMINKDVVWIHNWFISYNISFLFCSMCLQCFDLVLCKIIFIIPKSTLRPILKITIRLNSLRLIIWLWLVI